MCMNSLGPSIGTSTIFLFSKSNTDALAQRGIDNSSSSAFLVTSLGERWNVFAEDSKLFCASATVISEPEFSVCVSSFSRHPARIVTDSIPVKMRNFVFLSIKIFV